MVKNFVQFSALKLAVIYTSMLLVLAMAVGFSIYSDGKAQREREASAAQAMIPFCTYIKAQIDVYEANPPAMPTGKKLVVATKEVYATFQCDRFLDGKKWKK